MKLYLISQYESVGPDSCKSAVVAAPDSEAARSINPIHGLPMAPEDWDNPYSHWASRPQHVIVQELGTAAEGVAQGLICAHFRST